MTNGWSTLVPLVLSGLCVVACKEPVSGDTDDMTTEASSSSSSTSEDCPIGALGCMCTNGGWCDAGLICSMGICSEGQATTTMTVSTTDPTDGTTTTTDTGEPTTTGDPGGCDPDKGVINPDCPEEMPYCSASGICGDCSVLVNCSDVDADKTVCDVESGSCVQCTSNETSACAGVTPVCDEAVNTCIGCDQHSQCADSACNIKTGQCMDPDKVLYLYSDEQGSEDCTDIGGAGGTKSNPYCVVYSAVQHAMDNGGLNGWTFKMLPGAPYPQGKLILENDGDPITLAIIADTNESTAAEFDSVVPNIKVSGNFTLYLHNLDFESGAAVTDSPTLLCTEEAELDVSHSRVRGGIGPGIRGTNCALTVHESAIFMNESEGIEMAGGSLVMRNSFVTDNGGGDKWGGGGLYLDQVAVDIAYSTIVDNRAMSGADSIACTKAEDPASVRNSIIAHDPDNQNASVACTKLKISNSLVDGGDETGDNNVKWSAEEILELLEIEDMKGVYRLMDGAAAEKVEGIATWLKGDPRGDFEGDARPRDADSPDYPGADVFAL